MEITWRDFVGICHTNTKPFKPTDWKKVTDEICNRLNIINDFHVHKSMLQLKKRYRYFIYFI